MSVLSGTPADGLPSSRGTAEHGSPGGGPAVGAGLDRPPARADGLELIGEMPGSGYRRPPALVRRRDGQTVQLTPLLYLLLAEIDGERGPEELAARVSATVGRSITGADAAMLIDSKLRPLGLVRNADGSEPEVRKANPLLALRFRWVVSDPERTRRLTAPFARLFHPVLVLLVVAAFVAVTKWLLFDRGLGYAAHQAFARPGLLLAVFAITVVSAGFHEFGHAAAARYGGATPGAMGAGLYLISPAFYTDVTDSYRLGRGGRLRTDLGGLYFNALLSVAVFALWWVTGWDALLLVIGTQLIQMVRQLPPLVRFDGYHVLADLTGVPDLFHQITPTLAGLWPTRWHDPRTTVLKPWARAVVTLWVVVIVPLLAFTLLITVLTLPRIAASAAVSLHHQWSGMLGRFGAGDVIGGLAKVLAVIAVALPMFGIAYMLSRSVRQLVNRVLRATRGHPGRRAVAGVAAAAVIAGLAYAWWPHGNYQPIRATERGTLADVVPAAAHADSAGLAEGREGHAVSVWAAPGAPPDADHAVLALMLKPRGDSTAPTWVFPFNQPAPPGPGDNQSLAIATRRGSVVYDVAFAMVWAHSDTVLNANEAYAFASCSRCRATAISFQVVLIVGHSDVVVPQNISEAVSYHCLSCLAQALAVQLVVTLPSEPSAAEIRDLTALWAQIQAFSRHLRGLSYDQIHARLTAYEKQIVAVIDRDSPHPSPTLTRSPTLGPPTGSPPVSAVAPVAGTVAPGSTGSASYGVPPSAAGTSADATSSTSPSDAGTGSGSGSASPVTSDSSASPVPSPSGS